MIREEIMTTDQLFKQYNSTVKEGVPAPFVDLEKVTTSDLLDDKISSNGMVDPGEEDGYKNQQSAEKWKNWDDGD